MFGTADEPGIAVEFLREFSTSEFVGKLYTKSVIGHWTIAKYEKVRQRLGTKCWKRRRSLSYSICKARGLGKYCTLESKATTPDLMLP